MSNNGMITTVTDDVYLFLNHRTREQNIEYEMNRIEEIQLHRNLDLEDLIPLIKLWLKG